MYICIRKVIPPPLLARIKRVKKIEHSRERINKKEKWKFERERDGGCEALREREREGGREVYRERDKNEDERERRQLLISWE